MKAGIGYSKQKCSFTSGQEAAMMAAKQVKNPLFAVAFASVNHNLQDVQNGIFSVTGEIQLLGCASFAEVSNMGVTEGSVVIALFEDEHTGIFGAFKECNGNGTNTGNALGDKIAEQLLNSPYSDAKNHSYVNLMFCDMDHAVADDYIKGLRKAYKCRPMTYFGGGSSWDRIKFQERGYVSVKEIFTGSEVHSKSLSSAVLALSQEKGRKVGFGFSHGWTPVTGYHTVTKARENYVFEVDGKPVFEFYEAVMGRDFLKRLKALPGRYCFNVEYAHEDSLCSDVRNPAFFDVDDGSIGFFPPDPMEGTRFRMTYCTRKDLIDDATRAATECLASLGGLKPELVLMVSCVGRYDMLQSRKQAELKAVQEVFGEDVPIAGLYAGGEIGPLVSSYEEAAHTNCRGEIPLHHGVSLCLLAFGAPKQEREPGSELTDIIAQCQANAESDKDQEIARLRELLEATENYVDEASEVLTSICIRNVAISDALNDAKSMVEVQNRKLLETNDRYENLQDILRRYTPQTIWKKAGHSVEKGLYEIENEKVDLTFLFLDVKGFTAYAEKHDPDEVIAAINQIFAPVTEFIYERDGDIDKFIGDAILAIFNESSSALRAARKITAFMEANEERLAPFKVRIGINKGKVVMGNVGSFQRMDHTLIGDAVNLTQRLESACEPGHILISEAIFSEAVIPFSHVEKRELTVKGKEKPVTAYECW